MDRRNRPGPRRASARLTQTVILFARTVRLGRGKRRLAREIGDIGAWQFYRAALHQSLRIATQHPCRTVIAVLDPIADVSTPGQPFTGALNSRLLARPQGRGDLGQRMVRALNQAPQGPAVLIGADIQGLTSAALGRALKASLSGDVVFGPATDGGFWLLGARDGLSIRQFQAVGWSEPTTLAQSINAFPAARRVHLVDILSDVDSMKDLAKFS
jgi:uncharacterized protein